MWVLVSASVADVHEDKLHVLRDSEGCQFQEPRRVAYVGLDACNPRVMLSHLHLLIVAIVSP
jgi:hypothetical protein